MGIDFSNIHKKVILNKKVIISVLVIFIAVISVVFVKTKFFTKTNHIQNTARYSTLSKTNLSKSINTSGNIKSKTSAGITSSLDTTVKQINVNVGDTVKAGDVIAVMDTTDLEEQISKLQAEISESQSKAQTNLAEKQSAYEKAQASSSQPAANSKSKGNSEGAYINSTSQDNLEKAKSEYEGALQSYQNSSSSTVETQLSEKQAELAKAQVTAPFDGTITEVNAVVGEKYSGSLFTIQDLNTLIVNVNIDESDISKVQVGQKASIVVDAADGVSLEGQVVSVSPVANNYTSASSSTSNLPSTSKSSSSASGNSPAGSSSSSGSDVTFSAKIEIDTLDSNVKVGMNAVVNIILDEKDDIFAVPYESIIRSEKSSSIYAAVEINDKQRQGNKGQNLRSTK